MGPPWQSTMTSLFTARAAVAERQRGPGADGAARGQPEVAHDDVGAGPGHGRRVLLGEDVRGGEQVERAGGADHLDLEPVAHARLLELGANGAVEEPHRGEVLDAREAEVGEPTEEVVGDHEGVGAVDAGEHRGARDHRQHLARHVQHDVVGVAVGEEPGERAAAGHAVAAGVVDHDQVDPAGLLALGRQPGARAPADDGLAAADHAAQPPEDRPARDAGHGAYRASARATAGAPAISPQAATSASANA
jgi:hypothetical protein